VPPRAPERLAEIRGIGPASEEKLHAAGIRSVKDLALASPERVAEILGIRDMNKAKTFIDEAKRLIS
jgi:predicted flap endonuclease-1-like 5' DNA nuclease